MSYKCELKSNRKIKIEDVREVVNELPKKLQGIFECSETNWGWSCGCDVWYPEDNTLIIGGSYGVSGDIAEEFVDYFKNKLKEKGYKITTKFNW